MSLQSFLLETAFRQKGARLLTVQTVGRECLRSGGDNVWHDVEMSEIRMQKRVAMDTTGSRFHARHAADSGLLV
jgi:hypothetical protein